MTIIYAGEGLDSPVLLLDPNSTEIYSLIYRPETWAANKEYIQDGVIVVPTTPNGCMYTIAQGGKSSATEPVWPTTKKRTILNGTVRFKSMPYSLLLQTGDTIQANSSGGWSAYEVIAPSGVHVDYTNLLNASVVQFRVRSVPAAGDYTITVRISVLKAIGMYARYDHSIILRCKEM